MSIRFENIKKEYLNDAADIWNGVVEEADSFPGDEILSSDKAWEMFCSQTETVCVFDGDEMVGVYILHPNSIGRCAHISNASYAVKRGKRGQGIGRKMVTDCIERAKKNGFKGLQFNAVVSTNYSAIALYLKLGFNVIGSIKNGYRLKDNSFVDTIVFLKSW